MPSASISARCAVFALGPSRGPCTIAGGIGPGQHDDAVTVGDDEVAGT